MAQIVSVHSFRGGTGKSNLTANLAAAAASQGKRVGIVDTDIQSPGIHVIFGLDETTMNRALNDYLWGHCAIEQTAYDVTPASLVARQGSIHLIPSSGVPVAGIFPLSEEMLQLGSGGVFCLQYPEHPFTDQVRQVAGQILA